MNPARWAPLAFVFGVSFALVHRFQFLTPYIVGYDGYYHARFGWLTRTEGFLWEFPWVAYGVWVEHFADKELLYHLLLVPFTGADDPVNGIKWATVLLGTAVLVSFYLILRLERLRFPVLWWALLAGSGSWFLWRAAATRPQVLSILLLLWTIHALLSGRHGMAAVLAFVYTYSYAGFHLVLVLAVVAALAGRLVERETDWKTPAWMAGAMLTGMVLNPYFPDNFVIFGVQNFTVPWMALLGEVGPVMGAEFNPMTTRALLVSGTAAMLPFFLAFGVALIRPVRLSKRTVQLFGIAVLLILMTAVMRRFVEYSYPLMIWFSASFFTDHLREWKPVRSRRTAAGAALLVLAVVILFARSYRETLPWFEGVPSPLREGAAWLQENSPEGEVVFTCDWDDTPELFYFNQWNRYTVILDPNFLYATEPELWRRWSDAAAGRLGFRTYNALAEHFSHGICTSGFVEMRRIVEQDPRIEMVLDTGGAFVFRLDRENPAIPLDRFLGGQAP